MSASASTTVFDGSSGSRPAAGGGRLLAAGAAALSAAGGPRTSVWTAHPLSAAAVLGDALLGSVVAVLGLVLTLTARLGRGGNGVVFKAEDLAEASLGRREVRAVKLLVKAASGGFVAGPAAEAAAEEAAAAAAAAATHPHWVHHVTATTVGGLAATVSAVCSGDLWDFTWRGGLRAFDAVTADAFRQVLRVVSGLHEKGWVIGDIKPDNFFYDGWAHGEFIAVKIADLGGASRPGRQPSQITWTKAFTDPAIVRPTGRLLPNGDPEEEALCSQQGDAFSAGAVGYFILFGQFLPAALLTKLRLAGVEEAAAAISASAGRELGGAEALFVRHLARLLAKGGERATVGEAFRRFEAEAAVQLR